MAKFRIASPKPPSDMFLNALRGGGSHHVTCGFCGREHYCPDSDAIYEEDAADYLKQALAELEAEPEGVCIHYGYDGIEYKDLNGMNFVVDCPCNGLTMYEGFIWADRNSIRRYLGDRVRQEFEFAEQEMTKNKLAGIEPDPKPTTMDIWTGNY